MKVMTIVEGRKTSRHQAYKKHTIHKLNHLSFKDNTKVKKFYLHFYDCKVCIQCMYILMILDRSMLDYTDIWKIQELIIFKSRPITIPTK